MNTYTGSDINENLLLRAIAPRPLVWVTTCDASNGTLNMAPFSAITMVSANPPTLLLIVQPADKGGRKRTASNILATGEFIVNLPTIENLERLMRSAAPDVVSVDRAVVSSTTIVPGARVNVGRLAGVSHSLECRVSRHETMGGGVDLFFATVLCIHAGPAAAATPRPFLGSLGYEWFVSQAGTSFVAQPYLQHRD